MYRYYQTKDRGSWKPIQDSPGYGPNSQVFQQALSLGAKKLTVLAVSEVVDEFTNKDQLSYRGPLYFDIDCKDDLYLAIKSAKELTHKLLNSGVQKECILLFCSGSKGMHIIVDERAFSSGRPVRLLPKIYKEMAKALYVFGLDYQVYSGGRGNSWRLANIKREDGKYRVSISHEELASLTPATYQELVSEPRPEIEFPKDAQKGHAPELTTLFERGKQAVQKSLNKKQKPTSQLSDELLVEIKHKPPQCIEDMVSGKLNKASSFNEVSLQLAAYLGSVDADDSAVSSLSGRLAGVTESSTYSTERARLEHLTGLVGYVKHSGKAYRFSCGAVKKVIGTNPCEGCPINGKKSDAQKAADADDIGVLEKDDGYYVVSGDGERRISTFTLSLLDFHAEQQQDGSLDRRTGFRAEVLSKGLNCANKAEVFMSEDMWNSKASLIKELRGLGAIAFLGSDADVQRVKNFVFTKDSSEAGQITAVYTAGILKQKVGASTVMVYVEPEGSVNQLKVRDTHYLSSDLICPPKLLASSTPAHGDEEATKALLALTEMNSPVNMGLMLGWHVAAHFKAHCIAEFSQFPILNIWGPAGAGKTLSAVQMCFLNGCDYTAEHSPVNAAEASEWAMVDYCSTTTTVPRILDEANETKMKGKYFRFAEVVKSAWGSLAITRGTLRGSGGSFKGRTGARTVSIPISAPLILLSEQSLTMPAMQQRSIQVFLTKDARDDPGCYSAFEAVTKGRAKLREIGKALMIHALTTPTETVRKMIETNLREIPSEYDDRPRYSFAVVLTGLDLMLEVSQKLTLEATQELTDLRSAVVSHITESVQDIVMEKSRTEVDLIIQELAMMASLTSAGMGKELIEGTHFMVRGKHLILDYKVAFPLYTQFCAKNRKDVIIKDIRQFHALIRQEPYFEDEGVVVGFANRAVMALKTDELEKKGIDMTMFGAIQT